MFEVRRGAENLCSLKKKDFRLMKDKVYDFSYWKKVCFLRFLCLKKTIFLSFRYVRNRTRTNQR